MIPHAPTVIPKGLVLPPKAFPSHSSVHKAQISLGSFFVHYVKPFKAKSLYAAHAGRKYSWALSKGNESLQCCVSSAFMYQGDCNGMTSTVVISSLPASIFNGINSSSFKRPSPLTASVCSSRHRSASTADKPRWWLRSLACLPYLMPLHVPWMYAETGYSNHPLIEFLEPFAYPFCQYFIGFLPTWSTMLYYYTAYLGVVRRKEWPRFFRHHVILAMLLDNIFQVVTTASRWMPVGYCVGKPMMHIWVAVVFLLLFAVLDSMRRALAGDYPNVPFIGDAASIHMDARFG